MPSNSTPEIARSAGFLTDCAALGMSNRQIDQVAGAVYVLLRDAPYRFHAYGGVELLAQIWAGDGELRRPRVAWSRLPNGDV